MASIPVGSVPPVKSIRGDSIQPTYRFMFDSILFNYRVPVP